MKHYNFIFWAGVAMAVALFAGCSKSSDKAAADAGPPVVLKIQWQVGKRYENHLNTMQASQITMPGLPSSVEQDMSMSQDLSMSALKKLTNGNTQMAMDFGNLKLEQKMAGAVKLSFDSTTNPTNDPANTAALRQIVGAHFGYEMTDDGKAGNVTGVEEILAHAPAGDAQARQTLKAMVGEDFIKQLAMRGQGLPEKPVQVGERWQVHLDENAGPAGVLNMQLDYLFKGWEVHEGRKSALVEFTGVVTGKPMTDANADGISVEKGAIDGKEWFDPELQMVIETTSDQTMRMKIMARGKAINSIMNQHIDMQLVRVSTLGK